MSVTAAAVIASRLVANFGANAGYHMLPAVLSGGATSSNSDYTTWLTGYTVTVPAGESVAFTPNTGQPFVMDTFHAHVVYANGAGTFKLQSQTGGGGSWTDITGVLDANNSGAAVGTVVAGTLTKGNYIVRLWCVTGSVKTVGAIGYDSTVTGPIQLHFDRGGIGDNQLGYQMNTAIWNPIIADLLPDCVIWINNASPSGVKTYLTGFFALFGATDWVVLSGHPVDDSTADALQQTSDAYVQAQCAQLGHTFFDAWAMFVSYALTQTRFGAYVTHLPAAADTFQINSLFRGGFFTEGLILV